MIKGNYTLTIEMPGLPRPEGEFISIKGEFEVNSREELMDYFSQGVDAVEKAGREVLQSDQ